MDLIEKIARAQFQVHASRARINATPWNGQDEDTRAEYLLAARVGIETIEESHELCCKTCAGTGELGSAEAAKKAILLPCPFCGSPDVELDNLVDAMDFFVHCTSCEVQQIANYGPWDAVRRWNNRALNLPVSEIRDSQ